MKKLILTSATILFVGFTAFAQDGSKCSKKCDNKSDQKGCMKEGTCNKNVEKNDWASGLKCNPDNTNCKKDCKATCEKKDGKAIGVK